MLVLSLIVGVVAVVMAARWMNEKTALSTTGVVVATQDLPLGTRLTADQVKVVAWPSGSKPAGTFSSPQQIVTRVVNTTVQSGEPLLESKLAPVGSKGGLSALIPEGKRAISVKVNEVVGVAGFTLPGNFVDILVNAQDDNGKPTPVLIGFRAVYVFDVAQTEGADLPEFEHSITGEVGEHRDRLIAFLDSQNIALEYTENIAPALGVSYGGKIAILPGQSPAEEVVTLVHELAHEYLHKTERRTKTTATVRETEAEAVAFIVGQAIGLEMGRASSDYIQMYAGNAALLAESLEVIQRTSAIILDAITGETSDRPSAASVAMPETQDEMAEVA